MNDDSAMTFVLSAQYKILKGQKKKKKIHRPVVHPDWLIHPDLAQLLSLKGSSA